MNIINLDDHRPRAAHAQQIASTAPRLGVPLRHVLLAGAVLGGLVMVADLLASFAGFAVRALGGGLTIELPVRLIVGLAFGVWLGIESRSLGRERLKRKLLKDSGCSMNVHIFEDDETTECRCGQTCNAPEHEASGPDGAA